MNKPTISVLVVGAFALIALLVTSHSEAKEPVYVGDGRYVCQGSGCAKFDREQEVKNKEEEFRDRYEQYTQEKAVQRERDLRQIIDSINGSE